MSSQSVEAALSKAMSDAKFAEAILADPEKALAGYDLTAEEITRFKNLTRAQFEAMTPEDRTSFVTSGLTDPGTHQHNETLLSVK